MTARYYYMGSHDKKDWVKLMEIPPDCFLIEFDNPWDNPTIYYPYLRKMVEENGNSRIVGEIDNSAIYWGIINGHHCPTCGHFVLDSSESKEG